MHFRALSPCTLGCAVLAAAACTDRDPLDSATVSGTLEPGGGSTTEPTTEPPADPTTTTTTPATTTTTGEVPPSTTVLDTGDPTTSGTTGDAPVESGQFLLAVGTSLAPNLPIQFLATNTVTGAPGRASLRTELQPLAVEQGKVTTPRTPVGEPLVFDAIPVSDGVFAIDLGTVMIAGAANPVTGSDIVVTLTMTGEFVSEDFYCGTVDGELTSPLMASLKGSTFAAVRVDHPNDLPLDVTFNCAGDAATDP